MFPSPINHKPSAFNHFWFFLLFLGLYLSFHGYHSRDNDQAYRLPLLLDRQAPALFAQDPFVRAFDAFNPHRGYLALLDVGCRAAGLSATLAGLYAATFFLTCVGVARLARAAWPWAGEGVGIAAVGLLLLAKAGNIGTNHLFEPMLLDRLMAQSLIWLVFALAIGDSRRALWGPPLLLALAGWIHPSLGLQGSLLLAGSWVAWGGLARWSGVGPGRALGAVAAVVLGALPGLIFAAAQSGSLLKGLPAEELRLLEAYVQSPQHMLPHLWRRSQWLAWACYPVLAGLALWEGRARWEPARVRMALVLGVNLAGLGMAWVAVEGLEDLRCTLFQPFRLATIARGLSLVLVAGPAWRLASEGGAEGRVRAALLAVGLTGDWSLVVVTLNELAVRLFGRKGFLLLGLGLIYLARHDTESGHWRLMTTVGVAWLASPLAGRALQGRPLRWATVAAWLVPVVGLVGGLVWRGDGGRLDQIVGPAARHCRFVEVPGDDVERLALWCRSHTPAGARFIGPPQPKTFRLWSLRPVAFNRASSPYHAAGLADWAARFRDHVAFRGTTAEFARAYLCDRQGLERRYAQMTDAERAALAARQGADHVLAAWPGWPPEPGGPLELLRVEGRYAVYRVRAEVRLAQD